MKERTFYQAVEYFEDGRSLLLNKKNEKGNWISKFKSLDEAKREVEKAIEDRKRQYFYFRDGDEKIVDKISYYDRFPLQYKIYKIVQQEEEMFSCDNSDVELREPGKNLQEEIPL